MTSEERNLQRKLVAGIEVSLFMMTIGVALPLALLLL